MDVELAVLCELEEIGTWAGERYRCACARGSLPQAQKYKKLQLYLAGERYQRGGTSNWS